MKRIGSASLYNTFGHRGLQHGSAFCWLYAGWANGDPEKGIVALPDNARVVEVGNGGCHSLGFLCDVAKPGWTIYACDPYEGGERFKEFMQTCLSHLGDVCNRVQFIRFPSPRVASLFDDGSLDAVLIDAIHEYDECTADINAWWPKLKSGGYLAGDDCDPMFPGCERAWGDAFPAMEFYGSTACVRKP
jgi:hypothetical protein